MDDLFLDPFELELEEAMGLSDAPQTFVADLRKKVLRQSPPPINRFRRVWRWSPVVIGIILAILFFAIGPDNVVSAMRKWLGQYFPGIGFVDDSALLVLEKPVTVKITGAEASITQAYSNTQHLVIGFPETKDSRNCKEWAVYSPETSYLFHKMNQTRVFLPDGQELKLNIKDQGYFFLPPTIDQVIVRVPTYKDTPDCQQDQSCRCLDTDQTIDIPLKFVKPHPKVGLQIYDLQFTPVSPSKIQK
ncbi:MAG TPA: hypothetical protein VF338_05515 [Leptolinea sp.]